MDIWNILEIKPTSDQRVIKKAYAKRSREVHPEEKPEEFSRLYEAYKSALAVAKYTEQLVGKENMQADDEPGQSQMPLAQTPPQSQLPPQEPSEEKKEETSDVFNYFREKQEIVRKKVKEFQRQWDEIIREYQSPSAVERWAAYLKSQDFQEIRRNPQVLELLLQKIGKPENLEPGLALWDAYRFEEEKHPKYHGDILRLYEALLPAYYEKKKQEEEEKRLERVLKGMEKKKRIVKLWKSGLLVVLLLLCMGIPFFINMKHTEKRRTVSAIMREMYPGDSFTTPKNIKGGSCRNPVYMFNSVNHPDIQVQASLYRDAYSDYRLQENYGIQILQYYGTPYGLEFSTSNDYNGYPGDYNNHICSYVLLYSGIDDVGHVCDGLFKILDKAGDGELSFLRSVGICWKSAKYPKCMTGGGVQDRPPAQVYKVEELKDKETLTHSVENAWADYMYNYEAWNLTPQQHEAYGTDYAARQRAIRLENSGSPWSSDRSIQTIEEKFNLCIPIYVKVINPYRSNPNSNGWDEIDITIGNAYQLLKASGTAVSVEGDGSGFTAVKEGKSYVFGDETELNLKKVKELMEKHELVIQ